MQRVLLIGHSHTQCICEAMAKQGADVGWAYFVPNENGTFIDVDGASFKLNAPTLSVLNSLLTVDSLCISVVAGNAANFLTLMERTPPLDFFSPDVPAPPRGGVPIVPYGTVKAWFAEKLLGGDLTMLEGAKRSLSQLSYHIESPPPVRNSDVLLPMLDPYFRQKYSGAKIADSWLRLKMWKLQSRITKEKCETLGIEYIYAPPAALDEDGFLLPEMLSDRSCTHANIAYGQLVFDQIRGLAK